MPRPIIYVLLVLVALSLIPMGLVYKSRNSAKTQTRIQVVYDMDNQGYYKAQSSSDVYADGMGMRGYPEGVVARGRLNESNPYYRGVVSDTTYVVDFPLTVDDALILRGRERYAIYCAPCHGLNGDGEGAVHRRAVELAEGTWTPPTDLTGASIVERPVGHIFNTISRGIRKMPAYGAQIEPRDRWGIVAYVRALQLSRNATLEDLTPGARAILESEPVETGAANGD